MDVALPTPHSSKPTLPIFHALGKTWGIDQLLPHTTRQMRKSVPYSNSIATVCLPGTIFEKIDAVAAAGFDLIEIMAPDLDEASPETIYEYCASRNLPVSILQPFRDLEGYADRAVFAAKLAQFEAFLQQCRQLHCDLVLLCANCDAASSGDRALIVSQLQEAADVAAKYGVRVAYENLSWAVHNAHLPLLVETIVAVDRANFGICMDLFHINIHGLLLDALDAVRDKLFFVQLCDSPDLTDIDIISHARNFRLFPMQGDYANLAAALDKVVAAGFTGPLSLEVFNKLYKEFAANCAATADDALRSLLLLQAWHLRPELLPPVQVTGMRSRSGATRVSDLRDVEILLALEQDVANVRVRAERLGYGKLVAGLHMLVGAGSGVLVVDVPSRLLYNRYTLMMRAVFGLRALHEHELSVADGINLPLQTAFGNGAAVVALSIL